MQTALPPHTHTRAFVCIFDNIKLQKIFAIRHKIERFSFTFSQTINKAAALLTLLFHLFLVLNLRYFHRYSNSLWAGRSGDRIPLGMSFSAHVHTCRGAHPAFSTSGTGSFVWVKRPGRDANHPSPCSAKGKDRTELCSLYRLSRPLLG